METFAVAYCSTCKETNPIDYSTLSKDIGSKKIECTVAWCVVCEYVLNLEEEVEIKYVGKSWLKKHGWTLTQ